MQQKKGLTWNILEHWSGKDAENYETLRNRKEIVGLIEPEDLGPGFAVEHGP